MKLQKLVFNEEQMQKALNHNFKNLKVGWLEFNVPFQHKYGYIREERSGVVGWRVILTQWMKASDILTSTLAAFLFSSHPNK